MICAWQEYLKILPHWMRDEVDRLGKEKLQELRMRIAQKPVLLFGNESVQLSRSIVYEDIAYVINITSKYSPWSADSIAKGYLTAQGGHRIGICGDMVTHNGSVSGIRTANSLCIRVARDFPGLSGRVGKDISSVLIIGPPGSGKTTLLRDIIRQRSENHQGSICVLDERGEIFPIIDGRSCYSTGINTDIITGCSKKTGIDILLRTMGPTCIALDEITEAEDCKALINAAWCGVSLIATAHAGNALDLYTRPVYKPLLENNLFDVLITINRDKSWKSERICI